MAEKKSAGATRRRAPAAGRSGRAKAGTKTGTAKAEKAQNLKTVEESEKRAAEAEAAAEAKVETHARSVPVLVPVVHVRRVPVPNLGVRHVPVPRVSVPHVPVPHMPDAVRSRFPEPATNRILWLGGLAGLAAFGVIDWPVAGVVAAGTYVATRRAKAAMEEEHEKELSQA